MKTADLIKKREEEKDKPIQATSTTASVPPVGGMSMAEARMAGNGVPITETTASEVQAASTTTNPVSLYEIGKQNASTNIGEAEKMLKGTNVSPISTPAYEKFRNEVIGAQQFGVETEEQKKAREKRDFIKQGLTGFTEGLSALANLYYTTKGAPSQTLVSQMPELSKRLYAERLERDKKLENFRAWQRAKADKEEERAYNLNLFNLKQEAADKAAEKKAKYQAAEKVAEREFKVMFEGLQQSNKKEMAKLNDKLRRGQISYQEAVKLANKIAYDNTPGSKANNIADSVIGSDGRMWTRGRALTDNEMRQLVIANVDDLSPWTTEETDVNGEVTKKKVDYREAFADAAESGMIPDKVLKQMGFKISESEVSDFDKYIEDDEDDDFENERRK